MSVSALLFAALAFIPVVLAGGINTTYLDGLLQALNASGLHQFVNATVFVNHTTVGEPVLNRLSRGNNTIFAPTDRAWAAVNSSILNNQTALTDLIAYQIVSGNFVNQTQTYPNVTIGRTLLNDSAFAQLEGNQSQVLVWSKWDNGTFFVQNLGANITVLNATSYKDTAILTIDYVLIPPPNMTTVFSNSSYNLTTVAGILQSTNVSTPLQNRTLLNLLDSAHGITVFAPNDAAVQAAQSSLSGLSGNISALKNLLSNHVINGTSVYSPQMTNKTTYVSAGGQTCAFVSNSTGLFVSVGRSNMVQIVQANVLASNGVIQVVNGVMLDINSNPALASSAFASATSVAAHSKSIGTGPITPPTTMHVSTAKRRSGSWKLGIYAASTVGFMFFAI